MSKSIYHINYDTFPVSKINSKKKNCTNNK